MLHHANLSFILYGILKLLTYHTTLYHKPSLSYQRSNRSGFFGGMFKSDATTYAETYTKHRLKTLKNSNSTHTLLFQLESLGDF